MASLELRLRHAAVDVQSDGKHSGQAQKLFADGLGLVDGVVEGRVHQLVIDNARHHALLPVEQIFIRILFKSTQTDTLTICVTFTQQAFSHYN